MENRICSGFAKIPIEPVAGVVHRRFWVGAANELDAELSPSLSSPDPFPLLLFPHTEPV